MKSLLNIFFYLLNTALETFKTINVAALRIHNERGLGRGFWFSNLRYPCGLVSGINFETNLIFKGCQQLTNFMFGPLIAVAGAEFKQKVIQAGYVNPNQTL